jgi:rod shape-determining protein MreB
LLAHLISLAAPQQGQRVCAVVGVPAEALRVSRQHLRNAVKGIADSLMIVSEPFAVAYGLDTLLHSMIIDIGAGTTDFCVMNGHYPTDEEQRTLLNAGDAVDEQLMTQLRTRFADAQFTIHTVRQWKEKFSFVGEPARPVIVTAPVAGKPTTLDITNEVRRACESLVPPIVETMLDLISRTDPDYQEKLRHNIILAGGGSQVAGLGEALTAALAEVGGGRVLAVQDPVFAGSNGSLSIALEAPESDWEKLQG